MLDKVKMALRIKTDKFDDELNDLIDAAYIDMGIAGVVVPFEEESESGENVNAIITKAVITYCKMSFGLPEDYDKLKRSYDEQKAQLSNATGYTNWSVSEDV